MEEKLTLEQLGLLPAHQIFASGTVVDGPEGYNATNSGRLLKWVAVRGGIHDWAIYVHWAESSDEYVQKYGDKIYNISVIKALVPAEQEALDWYRY